MGAETLQRMEEVNTSSKIVDVAMDSPLRHLGTQDLGRRGVVAHELVVDIPADALLVDGERLHRELHAVERGRLPNKVGREVVRAVGGDAVVPAELERDLVRGVCSQGASGQSVGEDSKEIDALFGILMT